VYVYQPSHCRLKEGGAAVYSFDSETRLPVNVRGVLGTEIHACAYAWTNALLVVEFGPVNKEKKKKRKERKV
jgi:hypothetical protein